jgi:hypothetical protein
MTEDALDTDKPPTDTPSPQPVVPPASPFAKVPWWGVLAVTVIVIGAFFAYKIVAWGYITGHDEAAEREDWDQINGIVLSVDTFITLVIGALLGATTQSGIVAAATNAADKNFKEAEEQGQAAQRAARALRELELPTNLLVSEVAKLKADPQYRVIRVAPVELEQFESTNYGIMNSNEGSRGSAAAVYDIDPELDVIAQQTRRILQKHNMLQSGS